MKATEDKNNAIAQAEKTQAKANLADRLVNGLSGENKRWGAAIERFRRRRGEARRRRPRRVLVRVLRRAVQLQVPRVSGQRKVAPRHDRARNSDDARVVPPGRPRPTAGMRASGASRACPRIRLSIENGAIMTLRRAVGAHDRPAASGHPWIKEKWGDKLKIIQLSKPNYIDDVEHCIENGIPLMIENLQDDIDAVLDPVVARQTTERGRNVVMKLGDSEVDYDPNFKLYLQTKLSNPHYKPEIAAQTDAGELLRHGEGFGGPAPGARRGEGTLRLAAAVVGPGPTARRVHRANHAARGQPPVPALQLAGRHPGGHRAHRKPRGDEAHRDGDRREGDPSHRDAKDHRRDARRLPPRRRARRAALLPRRRPQRPRPRVPVLHGELCVHIEEGHGRLPRRRGPHARAAG